MRSGLKAVTVLLAAFCLLAGVTSIPVPSLGTPTASAQFLAGDVPRDPFYDYSVDQLAGLRDGDVVKSRPVSLVIFRSFQTIEVAFKSQDSKGRPIMATTTIVRPWDAKPNAPLVSYQHYINGLSNNCSPSQTLQFPTLETVQDSVIFLVRFGLMRGWTIAIPDHLGPRGAYTAARLGAHVTLDGIRAVQRMPNLELAHSPAAMIGYSGGGLTTAWAAALAPSYAPELNIVGAAQGGIPVDMAGMAQILGSQPHPAFGLAFAAAVGLEREYPELVDITPNLSPAGRRLLDRSAGACTAGLLYSGFMRSIPWVTNGIASVEAVPGLMEALRINSIGNYQPAPTMPIFQWHSSFDPLVPYWDSVTLAKRYCAAGVPVVFRSGLAPEHLSGAVEAIPDALAWLGDRFAGLPAPVRCPA